VEVIPVLSKSDSLRQLLCHLKKLKKRLSQLISWKQSILSKHFREFFKRNFFLTKPAGLFYDAIRTGVVDLFGLSSTEGIKASWGVRESLIIMMLRSKKKSGKGRNGRVTAEPVGTKKSGERFSNWVFLFIFSDVNERKKTSTSINYLHFGSRLETRLTTYLKKIQTLFWMITLYPHVDLGFWNSKYHWIVMKRRSSNMAITRERVFTTCIREIRPKEDFDFNWFGHS